MPSLAEADAVIASEASSAATIRTKCLIRFVSPSRDRDEAQDPEGGIVPCDETKSSFFRGSDSSIAWRARQSKSSWHNAGKSGKSVSNDLQGGAG
jgi:hypothetical protein